MVARDPCRAGVVPAIAARRSSSARASALRWAEVRSVGAVVAGGSGAGQRLELGEQLGGQLGAEAAADVGTAVGTLPDVQLLGGPVVVLGRRPGCPRPRGPGRGPGAGPAGPAPWGPGGRPRRTGRLSASATTSGSTRSGSSARAWQATAACSPEIAPAANAAASTARPAGAGTSSGSAWCTSAPDGSSCSARAVTVSRFAAARVQVQALPQPGPGGRRALRGRRTPGVDLADHPDAAPRRPRTSAGAAPRSPRAGPARAPSTAHRRHPAPTRRPAARPRSAAPRSQPSPGG